MEWWSHLPHETLVHILWLGIPFVIKVTAKLGHLSSNLLFVRYPSSPRQWIISTGGVPARLHYLDTAKHGAESWVLPWLLHLPRTKLLQRRWRTWLVQQWPQYCRRWWASLFRGVQQTLQYGWSLARSLQWWLISRPYLARLRVLTARRRMIMPQLKRLGLLNAMIRWNIHFHFRLLGSIVLQWVINRSV